MQACESHNHTMESLPNGKMVTPWRRGGAYFGIKATLSGSWRITRPITTNIGVTAGSPWLHPLIAAMRQDAKCGLCFLLCHRQGLMYGGVSLSISDVQPRHLFLNEVLLLRLKPSRLIECSDMEMG